MKKILNNKYLFQFAFILFCLLIFYLVTTAKRNKFKDLRDKGEYAKAVIYDVDLNSANRGSIYKYRFQVNSTKYEGDIFLKKINSNFNINDTIEIIYLRSNPTKNLSKFDYDKLYN
ncbi:MAG: hypothetical protein KA526_05095 [Chitinophagales bacterium]|jgi:hypothetical protein|nr:hypothetical protein [Chitinophagales bacterium]